MTLSALPPPSSAGTARLLRQQLPPAAVPARALGSHPFPGIVTGRARASRYRRHPSTRQGLGTRGGLWWVGVLARVDRCYYLLSASWGLLSHVWRQRSGALDFVQRTCFANVQFSSVQFSPVAQSFPTLCEEPELRLKGRGMKSRLGNGMWEKENSVFLGLHRPEEKVVDDI